MLWPAPPSPGQAEMSARQIPEAARGPCTAAPEVNVVADPLVGLPIWTAWRCAVGSARRNRPP